MDFLTHLKSYLSEKEIEALETSLSQKSRHGLLLNTDKMSQETLLSIYSNLKRHQRIM